MTRFKIAFLGAIALVLGLSNFSTAAPAPQNKPLVLLVVMDGLRADYISPELMPNLHALGEAGVVAERHHSVFPSVTRVNAPSIATGSYPASHGLLQNAIYIPAVSPDKIDTGDGVAVLNVENKTGGRLLTAPSLGELLEKNGKKLFVAGSSSTGTALLLNQKEKGYGIWNSRNFVKPAANTEQAKKLLGAFPKSTKPNLAGNRWAIRAILEHIALDTPPDAMILWITDPDGVGHEHGVGSPEVVTAIRHVDSELGYLLAELQKRGLKDKINILVSTDHGFSTYTGGFNLNKLLSAHGLDKNVTVVGSQVYVKDRDEEQIRNIVRLLQKTEWVGAIFTRAKKSGDAAGFISGTLSTDLIHWNHERAADILVDSNWTDATNQFGYRGTTTGNGAGGHGTSSPFDLNIRLMASGPDIKHTLRSRVPTGNIDLAPTMLHLLGIQPPRSMDGRVLKEILAAGPAPQSVPVTEKVERVAYREGTNSYAVELKKFIVDGTDYIDHTKTTRKQD